MARLEINGVNMEAENESYWCVVCGREIIPEIFENGNVYVHDDIPHPETMTFDEDERPQ